MYDSLDDSELGELDPFSGTVFFAARRSIIPFSLDAFFFLLSGLPALLGSVGPVGWTTATGFVDSVGFGGSSGSSSS